MFDRNKFIKVMDESGLTKSELASLYGVTRQTLYSWREHDPHQQTLSLRAEKYTTGLVAAMNRGLLPFPKSLTKAQRTERMGKMAQRLHELTAPK